MIYTCTTCRRPLIEVWSGWARCECGWLTTQKPMPWDRQNRYARGSQADPDGVKGRPEEFNRGPADALALMASSLLGPIEQSEPVEREGSASRDAFSPPAMTPAPTDAEWYAEAEGDPLWARFLDGDR
jgi:hypothetical protein